MQPSGEVLLVAIPLAVFVVLFMVGFAYAIREKK